MTETVTLNEDRSLKTLEKNRTLALISLSKRGMFCKNEKNGRKCLLSGIMLAEVEL